MLYITNSFTLAMLPAWRLVDMDAETSIHIQPVDPAAFLADAEKRHGMAISAVGHADTAALFSSLLDIPIQFNRQSIVIGENDEVLVGQYHGPRMAEGNKTLPEGAEIRWMAVTLL